MRSAAFCVIVLGGWFFAASASAESRTFVIAESTDGYGVDQCLANGTRCGTLIANAYCQSRDFAKAASFRRVLPTEITASIGKPPVQRTGGEPFFTIECSR